MALIISGQVNGSLASPRTRAAAAMALTFLTFSFLAWVALAPSAGGAAMESGALAFVSGFVLAGFFADMAVSFERWRRWLAAIIRRRPPPAATRGRGFRLCIAGRMSP